jgi:hypothetical protein
MVLLTSLKFGSWNSNFREFLTKTLIKKLGGKLPESAHVSEDSSQRTSPDSWWESLVKKWELFF